MGRAGAGSGSGGHSSGGHSSGRSSGGHHVSNSSGGRRAGSGGFSGGNNYRSHPNYHGYGDPFGGPPPYEGGGGMFPPKRHYGDPFGGPQSYGRGGMFPPTRHDTIIISNFGGIIAFIATIMIVLALAFGLEISNNNSIPKSTQNREKVTANIAYDNNCIVDNIGWFDNLSKTEKAIKYFYDKTGVQPYIVMNAYDSTLTTDAQKEQYAKDWYSEHIKNEDTFLFMYFAEKDTDNDVGYMAYVNGKQVSAIMDSEAVEIFWAYVDEYWYSNMSTDDMLTTIFTKTADRIMTKTTTSADIGNNAVKVIGIIVVFAGIIVVMVVKRKHDAEKAKETEKILNTPLEESSKANDLLKKYNKKGE